MSPQIAELTALATATDARISKVQVGSQGFWIKKREVLTLRRRLQKGNAAAAFDAERRAYQSLGELGLPVPPILTSGPDYFVIPDCGRPTSVILAGHEGSDSDRRDLMIKVAMGLRAFHATGVSHGRPSLKDILWDGQRVTFIDFERYSDHRNCPEGHAEDLVMLVFNAIATAQGVSPEVQTLIDTYRADAPPQIWRLAQRWCARRRWVAWVTAPARLRKPGKAKEFKAIPLTLDVFSAG